MFNVDQLVGFVRGQGFVLDFTDATFSRYFTQEVGADVNDPQFAKLGTSKGQ